MRVPRRRPPRRRPWQLVYQSRSRPAHACRGSSPTSTTRSPNCRPRARKAVVIVPLGFVSDHMEVLWDLDTEALETADEHGLARRARADAGRRPRLSWPASSTWCSSDANGTPVAERPARDRPRTLVRRLPPGLLRERARSGSSPRVCGGRPVTALFKPGAALRVGTRASALAVAQTIGDRARRPRAPRSSSSRSRPRATAPPPRSPRLGGTGVFASALRDALRAGEVDVVVHSLKDLPTAPAEGLVLAAVPERADARDALARATALTLAELPRGARVGTGSPRRVAQLLAARPDLDVVDIRGNVDTRLGTSVRRRRRPPGRRARARRRRSRTARPARMTASELLDIDGWPTAPGQGALALEVRGGRDAPLSERIGAVNHVATHLAATPNEACSPDSRPAARRRSRRTLRSSTA